MNKRQKGKLLVKKAKLILLSEDYLVDVCRPALMFIGPGRTITRDEDFFNRWDIVAVKKAETLWIQVSTWDNRLVKIKQIAGFPEEQKQQIWCYFPQGKNTHFRICKLEDAFEWKGECKLPLKVQQKSRGKVQGVQARSEESKGRI